MTICDGCKTRIEDALDITRLGHFQIGTFDLCVPCANKSIKALGLDVEVKPQPPRPVFDDATDVAEPSPNNALTAEELARLGLNT